MNEGSSNPYSTPEADLQPEIDTTDSFARFPHFSAWFVFFLSIVTLSLYLYYWAFTRTNMINKALPDNEISAVFVWLVLGLSAANILIDFVPPVWMNVWPGDPFVFYTVVYNSLNLVAIALWITWSFRMRNRINILSGAQPGDLTWGSGFLTFFFGEIYLAYKINQIKDSQDSQGYL